MEMSNTEAGKLAQYKLMQANQMVWYAIHGNISQKARMQLIFDSYWLTEQARWEYAQTDLIYGRLRYGIDFNTEAKPIKIDNPNEKDRFQFLVRTVAYELGWNPNPFVEGGLTPDKVTMPLAKKMRELGYDVKDKTVERTFFDIRKQVEAESAKRNGWGDLLYYPLNDVEVIFEDYKAHFFAYGAAISGYFTIKNYDLFSTPKKPFSSKPEFYKKDSNGEMTSKLEIIESGGIYKPNNDPNFKIKIKLNRDLKGTFKLKGTAKTWTVDPSMQATDEAAGVLINGSYIKNPTAQNINNLIKEGSNYVGNSKFNGKYMYVVDTEGNIIIGSRAGQHMPHPTLVGGANPQVQSAGIVEIRGGKIYMVDNASGHFKPADGSLEVAQNAFSKLPANVFSKDFQGYVPYER